MIQKLEIFVQLKRILNVNRRGKMATSILRNLTVVKLAYSIAGRGRRGMAAHLVSQQIRQESLRHKQKNMQIFAKN